MSLIPPEDPFDNPPDSNDTFGDGALTDWEREWLNWSADRVADYLKTARGPFRYKLPVHHVGADRVNEWKIDWDQVFGPNAVPDSSLSPTSTLWERDDVFINNIEPDNLSPLDPAANWYDAYGSIVTTQLDGTGKIEDYKLLLRNAGGGFLGEGYRTPLRRHNFTNFGRSFIPAPTNQRWTNPLVRKRRKKKFAN